MDIIQVRFAGYKFQCKLHTIHRLFGKQAVTDLFLSGHFYISVVDSILQDLIAQTESQSVRSSAVTGV